MKGMDKMIAGRVQMLMNNVFFGTLAVSMGLIESKAHPYAGWTDGKSLCFNPDFTDKFTKHEVVFLLAHEVMHVVLLHHLRRGARDPKVWNFAADYAINLLLKDDGFTLIDGCLIDEKYRDWSTEKIYQHLMDHPEEQPQGGGGAEVGQVMDGGSIGEDGEAGGGETMSQSAMKAAELDVKAKVQAAALSARKAGKLSANMERLINQVCAPIADWREILRRFISEKAFSDWEWGTCHTRILQQYGIITPTIGGEKLGDLGIIVDTSGSIRDEELAQFAGEINDVLENYECEVTVVYCDTRVNRVETFTQDDLPIKLAAVGMGGTAMKPAFDYLADQLPEMAAVVLYSDSYLFDWKELAVPECPALMACTETRPSSDTPEWIEVIDISERG